MCAVFIVFSALQLEIVVNVVCLFLGEELVVSINGFTIVPLSVLDVLSCTHNGNVELSVTSSYMIPVNEVDMSELAAVQLAVLNGQSFASAEQNGTEVTVSIHTGVVTGLVYVAAELSVNRTGMTVLMLNLEIGNQLAHNVKQVMLQVLEIERIDIVRALLNHNGTGGVVSSNTAGTVLDPGSFYDLQLKR